MRRLAHPVLVIALVLIALSLCAPLLGLQTGKVTEIAIYTLYGAGVNLLVGYAGLVPFGASVFFGCATYFVATGLLHGVPNEVAALLLGIVGSLALGLALGLIILRRRGLYFSLLTLAASQIAFEIAFKWTAVTGGENGLQNVPLAWLTTPARLNAFTIATVALALWALWRIAHAPFGRVLQAVRDNGQRATCLGYSIFRVKLQAFCICAVLVGYAGGLLALLLRGAYADNLSWAHAGDALLMVVLGGVHQFMGPLWGAIAFLVLQDRLSGVVENWWLLFAPVIMAFALGSPEGIQGLVQRALAPPALDAGAPRDPAAPRRDRAVPPAGGGRRSDAAGADRAWIEQALRLARHRARHRSRRDALPAAQLHRAERRRQDDLLQPAHRAAARGCGAHRAGRARHHAPAGACAHPPRPQPLLPDPERVPRPHRVRECPGRRAGAERPSARPLARRLRGWRR